MRDPAPWGTSDTDLGYLSGGTRAILLDSLLHPDFVITGQNGQATLSVRGHALVTLFRPAKEVFRQQLAMVRAYADLRSDRVAETINQTYDLLSFFGMVGHLSSSRNVNTLAVLSSVLRLAIHVEMPFKHFCRSPRPIDYAPQVQPMIQTPDHSSYPSGHAIEVFCAATVMARLMTGIGPKDALVGGDAENQIAAMPFRLAHRIATNRSIAGVHFPVDSAAGAVLGCALGEAVYQMATENGPISWPQPREVSFQPPAESAAPFDLTLGWLRDILEPDAAGGRVPNENTILGTLWGAAAAEWKEDDT
ncbi:MAG: phosphatase PAP2 family protein [Silicimonas sp.]|nr:phosphatase PAP2 family protein [Silicimonas sp.]